jgi:hypothetical protein
LVIFLLPSAIFAIHSFSDHHHIVCNAKVEKHIHEKDLDCNLHLIEQSDSNFVTFHYQFFNSNTIVTIDKLKNNFLKNHQQLSFSLRGPPQSV